MEDIDEKERLEGDKKIPFGTLLRRSLVYVKPHIWTFVGAGLLLLINVGLDVFLPIIMSWVTNDLTGPAPNLTYLIMLAVLSLVICVINNAFLYVESMMLQKAGQQTVYELRMDVFAHIIEMSRSQFSDMPVGSLVTRVTSYTQSMSDLFSTVIVSVIRNFMTVFGVYVMMFFVNPTLAAVLLIPVTVVFVSSLIFSRYVGHAFRTERKRISELNTFMNETLSGMKLIQMFCREKRKKGEFTQRNDALRKARFRVICGFAVYRPFITLTYISTIALVFWLGVRFGLDPGSVVAFYLYTSKFFGPIQQLADQLNNIQKALTASEKLFSLMDVKPEVRDLPDAEELGEIEGRIEFSHVWFAYEGENWILKDVSFTVEPGQTCAFVGATGAGKTTILSLLVRNYEIQKGQILIDGRDISKIKIKSLRRAVGQMLQDVILFSGTVKSNITLEDESFTDGEIESAVKYVCADTFIDKLPKRYDEELADKGSNLSQGQRQLLSFARTVLSKPRILILDEATANIDTETEATIQESLEKMRSIGTMLVVAHRLSTIQHADRIIVLQNGEVTEQGTHQELLAERGYYWKLYRLQFESGEKNTDGTPA